VQKDIDAVQNAITELWSNGQTEGQINRLKALKLTMYGRAGGQNSSVRACFLCSGHRNRK
jgi:transposase